MAVRARTMRPLCKRATEAWGQRVVIQRTEA